MVKNLKRLQRKLAIIPEKSKAGIRAALAKSADDIVAFMRRLAPVDTGDLRDSIGWAWGNTPPRRAIALGGMKPQNPALKDLQLVIFAGNDKAFYARWIEFGTRIRAANPFFFPAYRAGKKPALTKIRKAARDAAKQVAASG